MLHAVRRDMLALFKGLYEKVGVLDAKVDARLHDTVPLWEGVVSRLDTVVAEQESQGRRLTAIEAEQESQGRRLDAIETEQRSQGARLDAIEVRLDMIEVKRERFDAIDTGGQIGRALTAIDMPLLAEGGGII